MAGDTQTATGTIELKVPSPGESITEVTIGQWLKSEGDRVEAGEILVEIETDKVTIELPAPASGILARILKRQGDPARVAETIGTLDAASDAAQPPSAPGESEDAQPQSVLRFEMADRDRTPASRSASDQADQKARAGPSGERLREPSARPGIPAGSGDGRDRPASPAGRGDGAAPARVMPSAGRALAEAGRRAEDVRATGPGGRLLKEDVSGTPSGPAQPAPAASRNQVPTPARPADPSRRLETPPARAPAPPPPGPAGAAPAPPGSSRTAAPAAYREEQVVPMTPIRRRIAERLVQAQQAAAMLTTFNEIDMGAVQALRGEYQQAFQEKYGIKLGFMSFFVKAAIDALKSIPEVNAEIRGTDIVYRNYYDVGIAIGGGKGLVVPVLRNAERMSFAEIELAIADFAARARDRKLSLDELEGGTFTISNGGVYGSLLSTPILNPPQSGILGLHTIQDRPVARDGQIVIRSMMYVALTYDHRIVDGREAVTFLKRIKECIEAPSRMLIEA